MVLLYYYVFYCFLNAPSPRLIIRKEEYKKSSMPHHKGLDMHFNYTLPAYSFLQQ